MLRAPEPEHPLSIQRKQAKYNVRRHIRQGISNSEFYGNLAYKFKKIIGNPNFSDLFKRTVNRFRRAWYTLDIIRQTACLVFF